MKHLAKSFQEHIGIRGCHFYCEDNCNFLTWSEVFQVLGEFTKGEDTFFESLTVTLANYNPDKEYLAVRQKGDTVSVELYTAR